MKNNNVFSWLLSLVMFAVSALPLASCHKDDDPDDNSGGNGTQLSDCNLTMFGSEDSQQISLNDISSPNRSSKKQ